MAARRNGFALAPIAALWTAHWLISGNLTADDDASDHFPWSRNDRARRGDAGSRARHKYRQTGRTARKGDAGGPALGLPGRQPDLFRRRDCARTHPRRTLADQCPVERPARTRRRAVLAAAQASPPNRQKNQ